MTTLTHILTADPLLSDADALAAYLAAQPPEPRRTPIGEVRAYLLDAFLISRLGDAAAHADTPPSVAGFLREFLAGLQLAESFDGTKPQIADATADVTAWLAGAQWIAPAQAAVVLSFVRETPSATLADVATARLALAKDARLVAAEAWISGYRAAVNAAESVDALPEVPE